MSQKLVSAKVRTLKWSIPYSINDLMFFTLYALYKSEVVNYNISCDNLKVVISIAFGKHPL